MPAGGEIPEAAEDTKALQLVLEKRRDKVRGYFDELAGKFGRDYVPGRSWKGLAETLLQLMPPMVIGDLGAGEGTFSQLLAQRAERVIAVDNSAKMVEFGAKLAKENGLANLEYRLGDLESPPIEDGTLDLAFFSQSLHHALHPQQAVCAAYRLLEAGRPDRDSGSEAPRLRAGAGNVRRYVAGFFGGGTARFLEQAGFAEVESWIVDREKQTPAFETILAIGRKRG